MVQPGKKEVDHGSPFKDKANITISVTNLGGESLSMACSKPSSDSSSEASEYCIIEIESLMSDCTLYSFNQSFTGRDQRSHNMADTCWTTG